MPAAGYFKGGKQMREQNFNSRRRRPGFRSLRGGMQPGLPERIIVGCDADHPADKVLREQLKAERDIMPSDARAVAQTVFNYFRWRGWLDLEAPLNLQIRKTRELAASFAEKPESFSDASLVERVAPAWLHNELEITPAWARAIQAEPKLWLRSRRGQGTALCEKLGAAKLEKTLLPDAIHYKGEEDLFKRLEFHAGEFEIQDIASQAVGWLCAPAAGRDLVGRLCRRRRQDCCIFPTLMQNKGLIWASDRAEWRLKNLKRRAARAQGLQLSRRALGRRPEAARPKPNSTAFWWMRRAAASAPGSAIRMRAGRRRRTDVQELGGAPAAITGPRRAEQ